MDETSLLWHLTESAPDRDRNYHPSNNSRSPPLDETKFAADFNSRPVILVDELPDEHLAAYTPLINGLLNQWKAGDDKAPDDLRAHYQVMKELASCTIDGHDHFYADCFKQLMLISTPTASSSSCPTSFLTAEDKEDKTNPKPDLILRRGRNGEWRMIAEVVKWDDSLFLELERASKADGQAVRMEHLEHKYRDMLNKLVLSLERWGLRHGLHSNHPQTRRASHHQPRGTLL
ncbi:hypothetical protein BCR35DRAFT_54698 [Leucosporidium creatinivorum]|uniref:Uncharacterized protein n=1 Tax=Leucosporidium creatinivorum TaxID=106004 RepID=A0A1Y2FRR2_9BASI|nr:hypothetical protein BCR35DRAFT_54698 [Leucosporidium creatinivorum]